LDDPNANTRFLRALRTTASKLGAGLDVEHVLQAAATMVADFDAALAEIWLADEASDALCLRGTGVVGHTALRVHPPATDQPHPVAEVKRSGTPFVSNDLPNEPHLDQDWIGREKLAAMAALPLLIRGKPRGVLVYFFRQALTEEMTDALAIFASILSASLDHAESRTREQQIRAQAEEARRRAAFLAESSTVLTSSLDYPTTLASVAQLAVPQLADWCAVYMLEPDGSIRLLAVTHVDPAKIEWAQELGRRYPPDPGAPHGVPRVLHTGRSEIYADVPEAVLQAYARDAEHLRLLRELGLQSYMIVPLIARTRMLGALGFACAETGRHYGPDDLALAEDLAHRAATAIDHALLYRQAQEAIAARDQFLSVASHELRTPLSPIQLQVQLLLRAIRTGTLDKIPQERLREMVEMCDRQVKLLVKLVNDLLTGFHRA
jgi:GAF domain-containing protein